MSTTNTEITVKSTLRATIAVHYSGGCRIKSYVCKLADTGWQVTGRNRESLMERLRQVLTRQEQFLHTRRYIRKGNVTFALYYANGWQYDIVRDDGRSSASMLTCDTYMQALEIMTKHANQHDGN